VSELIRHFFSFFSKNDKELFFDSAATSLKPDLLAATEQKIASFATDIVHRSSHFAGSQATQNFENVRQFIAKKMNADRSEIVFTSGATAGFNIAALSWAEKNLKEGDEIIISIAEHHSSCLPWIEAARRKTATISWAKFDKETYLFDQKDFVFTPKTKVLVVSAYSNVLGPIWKDQQELYDLISRAHSLGIIVVVDGAQQAPFYSIDLKKMDADFYAFSAHKMLGPQGVGVLFVNKRIHSQLSPAFVGGGALDYFFNDTPMYKKMPFFLESGTPPVAAIISFGEVLKKVIPTIDVDIEYKRIVRLMAQFIIFLKTIPGVTVLGNEALLQSDGHLVSFLVDGLHAHDIAEILSAKKVYVRAGKMCAHPLFDYLNCSAALRVSMYWYTTEHEVVQLCSEIADAIARLREL